MKTLRTLVVMCLGIALSQTGVKSKVINAIEPLPVKPMINMTCCPKKNILSLDLMSGHIFGSLEGATLLTTPTGVPLNGVCDKRADLRINFQKLDSCLLSCTKDGCLNFPACGRRMLRVDLYFDITRTNRKGHVFNIGDSQTNNGYGGDSNTQTNDAEIHGTYPHIRMYKNDNCLNTGDYTKVLLNALNATNRVSIYVSNEHVTITNDNGLSEELCHKCFFALNGQPDSTGSVNEDIYVSLNKVISGRFRTGVGLCFVYLSWQCRPKFL